MLRYGDFSEATEVVIRIKPKVQQAVAAIAEEVGFTLDEVYNEMLETGIDEFLYWAEYPMYDERDW